MFAIYHNTPWYFLILQSETYHITLDSVLHYGKEFWKNAADWERAFRLQRRAIRVVAFSSNEDSIQYFASQGTLTLPSLLVVPVRTEMRNND